MKMRCYYSTFQGFLRHLLPQEAGDEEGEEEEAVEGAMVEEGEEDIKHPC